MKPDLSLKPQFRLMMNCGQEPEKLFDYLEMTDEQWDQSVCSLRMSQIYTEGYCRIRDSGVQYDDRVVECVWDPELQTWKILRFRDDKREGNYKDIVQKILISIKDGVEQPTVSLF